MPQYLPGSEAFVDAVLERDKNVRVKYLGLEWNNCFLYHNRLHSYYSTNYNTFHSRSSYKKDTPFIGVWKIKI